MPSSYKSIKEDEKMLIKIKLTDDEVITRINCSLAEVGKYYFSAAFDAREIEILDGGILRDDEQVRVTATLIYKAEAEDVKKFGLTNNIRYCYLVESKTGEFEPYKLSAGLCCA